MTFDLSSLTKDLVDAVQAKIAKATRDLADRLSALESRKPESTYDLAVKGGFVGSEADFLQSIQGKSGKDGKDGRDGRDGRDGESGRDALAVDVLPSIDEARSYAKGTWASHLGGLWVARKQTRGMEGWDCIVNGYCGVELLLDEDWGFEIGVKMSDGQAVRKKVSVPAIIDKGVFKDGVLYKQGHAVTWGGSLWVCQGPTDARPGTDDTWRLAVKKGRDGKDGKDGRNGRDGENGKDWTGKRVE